MIDIGILASIGKPQVTELQWGDGTNQMSGGLVTNRTEQVIFSPTTAGENVYAHHTRMCTVGSRVYMIRSSHNFREDGRGQWALFTYSDDAGVTWAAWQTLVPSLDENTNESSGIIVMPMYLFNLGGIAYAICHLRHDGVSTYNHLAIPIEDGIAGTPFLIRETAFTFLPGYPSYEYDTILGPVIREQLAITTNIPWYVYWPYGYPSLEIAEDLVEPSGIILANGYEFILFRKLVGGTVNKYYIHRKNTNSSWSASSITPIPDCNSGSTTIWKRYGNYIYISGNSNDTQNSRGTVFIAKTHYKEMNFASAKMVVSHMGSDIQFGGANKNGGYSYVDFVKVGNKIVHCGSRGKEDIHVYTFDDDL